MGKLKEEARLADGKVGFSKDTGKNAAASVPDSDVDTSIGKLKEQAQVADGEGIFSEELDETVVVSAVNGDVHSSS